MKLVTNVAVWGVGSYFYKLFPCLVTSGLKIDYVIDSDEFKQGKKYTEENILCISPDEIGSRHITYVLIATINKQISAQIEIRLRQEGVEYDYADWYLDGLQLIRLNKDEQLSAPETERKLKRVIFLQIPTNFCNMRCEYCYLIQKDDVLRYGERTRYPHRPEFLAAAMSRKRLGGMAYIDITTTGETLLYGDVVELTRLFLIEGHVVSITTNGTVSKVIDRLLELPDDLKERLFIRCSFHYLELKRLNMLDEFFENVRKIRNSAASVTVMMVASDVYLPYKEEIKSWFMSRLGALPQLDFVRESTKEDYTLDSDKNLDNYIKVWDDFQSKKFEHRKYYFGRHIHEFCHAGNKCFLLNIFTGEVSPCPQMPAFTNAFTDISKEIELKSVGQKCPCEWCIYSIMWANFGAIDTPWHGQGYAETLNRIDAEGNSWIKPKLYSVLNMEINGQE